MAWIEPKTNWTEFDNVNHNDFNRIENNTKHLSELIETGLVAPVKNNWSYTGFPFSDELNRIERNIEHVRLFSGLPQSFGWDTAKTNWEPCEPIFFTDILRMEMNVLALKNMYELIPPNFKYCGTFSCGEVDVI